MITLYLPPFLSFSQPKTTENNKGLFRSTTAFDGTKIYALEGKKLTYNSAICGYFNQLLMPQAASATLGNTGILNDNFIIQSCNFQQTAKTVTDVLGDCPNVNLEINKYKIGFLTNNKFDQPLVISGISGSLNINSNQIPYLAFRSSNNGNINVSGNTLISNIDIQKSHYGKVELLGNVFRKDSVRIDIMNSYIKELYASADKAKVFSFYLTSDTIGLLNISCMFDRAKPKYQISEINLYHCHLSNLILTDFDTIKGERSFHFYNCSFGSETNLLDVNADTLEFVNCINIEPGMSISGIPKPKPTILKFYHTDLTNIDFDYDNRYALYHWQNDEITKSIFEKLLAKFQNEKKLDSYERIDIEYFQFKHSWLVNVLSRIWWNYGYNKLLIILWTAIFLLLFSLINFFNWQALVETYPIKKSTEISSTISNAAKALKIFIYTAFIFFSLKVDFDKVSFKKTGWLAYFFLQYVVGLICLFFIANAILKL